MNLSYRKQPLYQPLPTAVYLYSHVRLGIGSPEIAANLIGSHHYSLEPSGSYIRKVQMESCDCGGGGR